VDLIRTSLLEQLDYSLPSLLEKLDLVVPYFTFLILTLTIGMD